MLVPASEVARDAVEAELARAGVPSVAHGDEEWIVIDVEGPGDRDGWTWEDEVKLLRLLTQWPDGESRTLVADRSVRRRLLWAMTAAGQRCSVRWTPSYRPVEARVTSVEREEVFSSVVRSESAQVACRALQVEASALIVDCVYVLPDA